MHYLVLGGLGFLGLHLTEALSAAGHTVRCFDRPNPAAATLLPEGGNVEFIAGDFTDRADLDRAMDGIDICYHLVSTTIASTSNQNPKYDVQSNVIGSINVLEAAVAAKISRLVFVSSGGTVYGIPREVPVGENHPTNPISSYGITKLAIEKYIQLFHVLDGLDSVILRLANPYGERQRLNASQGAIAVFLGHALRNEEITIWGDGTAVRDYLHVSDVTRALVLAGLAPLGQQHIFNIGSGKGQSINEILDTIETVTGRPARRTYLPRRVFDVQTNVLNCELAAQVLGWRPKVTFPEGIAHFYRWVQETGPVV